ncbi:hypothetical protein CHH83_20825 [Bacillus sp. 7586-K]|nr:hypothetical protein CHH83_20825 [Bacillus sp. 7586-K]
MRKSFQEQLKQWKKDHMHVKEQRKCKPVKRKPNKRYSENLSQRELRDLMGMNRQILHRGKGGAYK